MSKNSFEYRAIIRAVDKASGPMKKVQAAFSPLTSQFQTIGRAAQGVGSSVGKIFKPLSVIGIGGAAAIGAAINKVVEYGDTVAKTADRIGFGIENFQRWQYAANQSGISSEEYTKSLEIMTKRMGQLKAGTGPLISGLEKVSPALLKQVQAAKSNEEAFDLMINAIRKVKDADKKAYLADIFFGKSGNKLITLANTSSEAIEDLKKRADELGIMSESAARSSEEFGDKIDDLKKAMFGVSQSIVSNLMPTLMPLIEKLIAWITANRELIATKVNDFINSAASAMKTMYDIGSTLLELVGGLEGAFYIWGSVRLVGVVKSLWDLGAAISGVLPAFMTFFKVLSAKGIMSAVKAVWSLNAAFAANPIGVIIVAVIALAAAVYLVIKKWSVISKFFKDLWSGVKNMFSSVMDWIISKVEWLWKYSPLRFIIKGIEKIAGWFGGGKNKGSDLLDVRDNSSQINKVSPNNFTNLSGGSRSPTDINIKFDNLPRNTSVSTDTHNDPMIDLGVTTGYATSMELR